VTTSESSDRDYVLGTHDEEIARLALQHRVWREHAIEGWRIAGIGSGQRVLDVGSGPGFVALDLARTVGASGQVIGIERSARFIEHARALVASHGLAQVEFREADLDALTLEPLQMDATWCRWVAAFVTQPQRLVENLGRALRSGGIAVFHEYSDYSTWRLVPDHPAMEAFVRAVMDTWRAAGGDADIGRRLPAMLVDAGFEIRELRMLHFASRPGDAIWPWPAAFIEFGTRRMESLGRLTPEQGEAVRRLWANAAAHPAVFTLTPAVIEVIAARR
jgi:ubiquinone/menaquinone biosynthesis C-methylase UbiE